MSSLKSCVIQTKDYFLFFNKFMHVYAELGAFHALLLSYLLPYSTKTFLLSNRALPTIFLFYPMDLIIDASMSMDRGLRTGAQATYQWLHHRGK